MKNYLLTTLAALSVSLAANAQTVFEWNTSGNGATPGGTGTLNTSNAFWWNGSSFVNYSSWSGNALDSALFTGSGGNVTVSAGVGRAVAVDVNGYSFESNGQSVTGNITLGNNITLGIGFAATTVGRSITLGNVSGTGNAKLVLQGNQTVGNSSTIILASGTTTISVPIEIATTGAGIAVIAGQATGTTPTARITGNITNGSNNQLHFRTSTASRGIRISGDVAGSSAGVYISGTQATGTVLFDYAGTMSYTGDTVVSQIADNTFRIGSTNVLPTATSLVIGDVNNTGRGGTTDLNGFNVQVGTLSSVNSAGGVIRNNSATTNSTLTVGGSGAGTFAATIQDGTTRNVAFTRSGTGSTTFASAQTYTGATTVSGGTLILASAGSISNSSPLTISGGEFRNNSSTNYTGTFSFTSGRISGTNWNGSLSGLTIAANQTLSPGNSPGTASTGSQTWAGGGTYLWELNDATGTAGTDPGWDLVSGSGALSLTATSLDRFTINITSLTLGNVAGNAVNFNPANDYTWLIADFGSSISGFSTDLFTLNRTNFTNTVDGFFGIALGSSVGGDDSQIYLTYSAIPEPSTYALLALGLAGVLFARRRRARV